VNDRDPAQGCAAFEEAISARVDGEDPAMADDLIDAHLEECASCRAFRDAATAGRARLASHLSDRVPDLSGRILAVIPPGPAPRRPLTIGERALSIPQLAAAAVVVVIILVAGFVIGGRLAGGSGGSGHNVSTEDGVSITQVAGSTESSPAYPGASVLPTRATVDKPQVVLTDTIGKPYNVVSATAHRVTLLYFGYTHCPDVCPLNMALTAYAIHDMPAALRRDVTVLFITTDPTRDTPSVIRTWLGGFTGSYPGDPSFVGLTGPQATIHAAERQVGMPLSYAEKIDGKSGAYDIVHAGYTLVYSQDDLAHISIDDTETPTDYATTLEHLVTKGFQS
jgi:protein SCO1/2